MVQVYVSEGTFQMGGLDPQASADEKPVQVGSYPAGTSPFGALDMAGNVLEWTSDYYDAKYYANSAASTPTGPEQRTAYFKRVVRGGSYADVVTEIRVSNRASALGPNPDAEVGSAAYLGDYSPRLGFRCASE